MAYNNGRTYMKKPKTLVRKTKKTLVRKPKKQLKKK